MAIFHSLPDFTTYWPAHHRQLVEKTDHLKLLKLPPLQLKVDHHSVPKAEGWLIGEGWCTFNTAISQLSIRISICCWIISDGCWHLTTAVPTIPSPQHIKVDFTLGGRRGKKYTLRILRKQKGELCSNLFNCSNICNPSMSLGGSGGPRPFPTASPLREQPVRDRWRRVWRYFKQQNAIQAPPASKTWDQWGTMGTALLRQAFCDPTMPLEKHPA